ncbi:hypothetical protein N665_0062s0040 [Sinapis alba]|nr:hypothetical protein N665_0062s0040 [Sinapis alba]
MANTSRISYICLMVLLLFTNHLALSSSARLRFIEGQDLVHWKQTSLLKLDEIGKADRARLDYLFGMIDDEAETNRVEEVALRVAPSLNMFKGLNHVLTSYDDSACLNQ